MPENKADIDYFFLPGRTSRYDHIKGDALTVDGIPYRCKKHNKDLVRSIGMNGIARLRCPNGDTVYEEKGRTQ